MLGEEQKINVSRSATPTIIEDVDIPLPPAIDRLAEAFKSESLKDIQHEIQTPGKPHRGKVGRKIADLTHKTRQSLKKKGVLQVTGRKLYVTGGVVRDWLINHYHGIAYPPDDYDLATDASAESLNLIIKAGIAEGLLPEDTKLSTTEKKFGNLSLSLDGQTYEVTTFPFASYDVPRMYLDSHRRNFNVNALYYSIDEKKIYDYHSGITDIYRKTPQSIGDIKKKIKEEGVLYPLILVRLLSRMNSKGALDEKTKEEIRRYQLPPNVNREDVYKELSKGVKQSLDRGKYFSILDDVGLLKQILPGLQVSPHTNMGDMVMFPQVLAKVLQPNWNNIGYVSETLRKLNFPQRDIHDIMFLLRLPFYRDEQTLKSERMHTGLSDRAIEQFAKVSQLRNIQWIVSVIKNLKRPLQ